MNKLEFCREIEAIIGAEPGSVAYEDELSSLIGWDSMAYVSFIAMVDEKLTMAVDVQLLSHCRTVKDLAELVADKLA